MNEFIIVEQLNESQIKQLHNLCQEMWWCKDRTMQELLILLENCMSLAIVEKPTEKLIGYARILTDEIKYAYIFDVMIAKQYRKKGLGKILMKSIIKHPKLHRIKYFELTCKPDMISFYEKFNFNYDFGEVKPMRLQINVK